MKTPKIESCCAILLLNLKASSSFNFHSKLVSPLQVRPIRYPLHQSKSFSKFVQLKIRNASNVPEHEEDNLRENKVDTAMSTSSELPRVNLEAVVFMSLLAIQFGIQPGLVRAHIPQSICKSSVVLVQEFLKCFFAAISLYASGKDSVSKALKDWKLSSAIKIAGIPAFLYLIQNLSSLLAYQNLQPLTFNVLNQTKTLSAALCCYLVIGRKQSREQVGSLFLLLGSALVIEKIIPFSFFSTASAGNAVTSISMSTRHWTHGVAPILLASFISGLAGALSQKNLQSASGCGKSGGRNPFLFSIEMNFFSMCILLTSMLVSSDGKYIAANGFFHNWTSKTIIPVTTNALGGIIVGLVTKYAGSVKKGFALIFGILISGMLQVMGSGGGLQVEQIIGGVLAGLSLWIHTAFPYQEGKQKSN